MLIRTCEIIDCVSRGRQQIFGAVPVVVAVAYMVKLLKSIIALLGRRIRIVSPQVAVVDPKLLFVSNNYGRRFFFRKKRGILDPDEEDLPSKRPRVAFAFRTCCQKLARHVATICDKEKSQGYPDEGVNRSRERAAHYLGISRQSLHHLLALDTMLLLPGECAERDRGMAMSDEDASVIRPALVALVLEKKTVTLDALLARIRSDNPAWGWSRSTLERALKNRCGFKFTRRSHDYYVRLRENPENVQRRAKYLQFYFLYESQQRTFVYMDETWMNQNMVPSKCWTDGSVDCEPDVPPGKGPRWIVIGAGSKAGWVPNSFVMWKGNILSEDYHSEMNGDVFQDWFCLRLLPNVAPNACIVIDRAPYHTLLTEQSKGARSTFNREQLAEWLVSHGAKGDDGKLLTMDSLLNDETVIPVRGGSSRRRKGWAKQSLYALAFEMKPKPQYMVHEWTKAFNAAHGTNITVLLLPVAHPVLNPIELIWNQLKRHVRQENHEFDMAKIRELAFAKQESLGAEDWKAACEHSHAYALDQWAADEMILQEDEGAQEEEEDVEDPVDPQGA